MRSGLASIRPSLHPSLLLTHFGINQQSESSPFFSSSKSGLCFELYLRYIAVNSEQQCWYYKNHELLYKLD